MGLKSEEIDHKDQNKLNCQRSNLRESTSSQNKVNRGRQRNNTSGYKGVTRATHGLKWQAGIGVKMNGKRRRIHLGKSNDVIEAAKMYDKGALLHYGNRAELNLPNTR
jgi:hypothetical protein